MHGAALSFRSTVEKSLLPTQLNSAYNPSMDQPSNLPSEQMRSSALPEPYLHSTLDENQFLMSVTFNLTWLEYRTSNPKIGRLGGGWNIANWDIGFLIYTIAGIAIIAVFPEGSSAQHVAIHILTMVFLAFSLIFPLIRLIGLIGKAQPPRKLKYLFDFPLHISLTQSGVLFQSM